MVSVFFLGPRHPIFETVVKYPPEGYNVISNITAPEYSSETIKEYHDLSYLSLKKVVSKLYRSFHLPRMLVIPRNPLYEIIFAVNALPITNKPCIVGVETIGHLLGGVDIRNGFAASFTIKYLHKKCNSIVAISNASKESIINYVGLHKPRLKRHIAEKIDVVYPAIDPSYTDRVAYSKKIETHIQLVHVNTRPLIRGLIEFLEVSKILGKKYDIGLRIKLTPRFVTQDVLLTLQKYSAQFKKLNMSISLTIDNLKKEDVFKLFYARGNIFVLPTWMDSFGYVFLEAMSSGLPCIGTDLWAIPEIISEGVNGYLIRLPFKPYSLHPEQKYLTTSDMIMKYNALINEMRSKVIKKLVEKIEKLIINPDRMKMFGVNAKKVTHEGKFSVKEQQAKLKAVFEKILRR